MWVRERTGKGSEDMEKTKGRLVAFDMDGTMVDDEWAHTEANRLIAQEMGLPAEEEKPGFSVRMGWERRLARLGITADVEAIARDHFRRTLELVKKARTPEAPGLTAALDYLTDRGWTVALVSSSDGSFVRGMTDYLGVTDKIHFFVTAEQVQRLKPEPDLYLEALRLAGVPAARALGVEDSTPGCQALHRAGMYAVGFLNQGRNPEKLEEADVRVDTMDQLIPLLERMEREDR